MVVDGGTYKSTGVGSPAIYCTADISVNDAKLTATGSEALCLEGKNTVRLFDSDLNGSMKDDEQNDCTWNVILYQSMSGDSEEGTGTFEMDGGALTAENGGITIGSTGSGSNISNDGGKGESNKNETYDEDKVEKTTKKNSSNKNSDDKDDKSEKSEKSEKSNLKLFVIAGAIVIGLISVEIFAFKLIKMLKGNNSSNSNDNK
jgi:hypothetical protein